MSKHITNQRATFYVVEYHEKVARCGRKTTTATLRAVDGTMDLEVICEGSFRQLLETLGFTEVS